MLEVSIGTFQREKDAYNLVMLLSWLLPCILIAGAVIDAGLVVVYMKYLHPWIGILSKEKKIEKSVAKNENCSLNSRTKLTVFSFCAQDTIPPLCSSLVMFNNRNGLLS